MIDRAQLDEIRARVKLADLIGKRVPLRRQGGAVSAVIPRVDLHEVLAMDLE